MNNTNPILSDESEKMKNRELLEEYFSCSLEINLLLRLYPDDEDTLYQIVNLLVDTCATNRKLLHIAGDDKPAEVNEMVRTAKVTPEQLAALLRQSATATPNPAALSAVGATFEKEDDSDEV